MTVPKTTTLPTPACFRTCVECQKENSNPYFQYCHTCFRVRNRKYYDIFIVFIYMKHILMCMCYIDIYLFLWKLNNIKLNIIQNLKIN